MEVTRGTAAARWFFCSSEKVASSKALRMRAGLCASVALGAVGSAGSALGAPPRSSGSSARLGARSLVRAGDEPVGGPNPVRAGIALAATYRLWRRR